jgi:hypothetical protein
MRGLTLFLLLLPALLGGCTRADPEPAVSVEQAAALVMERIEAEYPTGLGTTWDVDIERVDLVWESPWLPWQDRRPLYEVRVVTSGPLDPADPEGPLVNAATVFEVDGMDGTVGLRTEP